MLRSRYLTIGTLAALLVSGAVAQSTRRPKKPSAKAPATIADPTPSATPQAAPAEPPKRNERPGATPIPAASKQAFIPVYFYKFSRPGFLYPAISIEFDESGTGKITFTKDGWDESVSDPIRLSPKTLENIRNSETQLNFLDSTEVYQYKLDHSNLGNAEITIRRGERSRTVKYNWTENKIARSLADEFRRISNEYIWKFEITVARQNQPLETPRMMETIDGYNKRGELTDPPHLIEFLNGLANDERLPLMARNHAARIINDIQAALTKK